jgi:ribonuclease BN (tRNA processing enzyme)
MNIRFLGAHACEWQKTRLISLLIDDVLAIDAGALTSSLSIEAQQKIKAILLTHQHYDHIRDIPTIAINLFLNGGTIKVYSIPAVFDVLARHLLNDEIYPDFRQKPAYNPTISFTIIEPHQAEQIEGYTVLAVPVNHNAPAVGYQVTSADGQAVFYTGDTSPGLANCWRYVSPQLLISEVTASDRYTEWAAKSGHLTPSLLKQELVSFQEVNGYLPRVVVVHMDPALEEEIAAEMAAVAKVLGCSITIGYEGMQLSL